MINKSYQKSTVNKKHLQNDNLQKFEKNEASKKGQKSSKCIKCLKIGQWAKVCRNTNEKPRLESMKTVEVDLSDDTEQQYFYL